MKTLFKILSTLAFALVLFVPAKNALSDGFPAGVSFKHIAGAMLEPHASDKVYTTLDSVNFGFETKYIKICLRSQADNLTAYFRMGTTVSNSLAIVAAATNSNKMTIPISSSDVFILGAAAANSGLSSSFDWGALSMSSPATTGGNAAPAKVSACITEPWRTRGIVMHIVSGLATADVWGYQ